MFLTVLNVITGMMWGGTVKAEDRKTLGAEFRQVVNEMVGYLGMPNMSNFYPVLALFDFQGIKKNMKVLAKRLDGIFESVIDQRRKMDIDENKDFLQFLLKLNGEGGDYKTPFTIEHLKCLPIETLINVVKNDISDDSLNDPLLEKANLFLASDNSIPPGIENFGNDSEGDIRFLEALLIDDSIPFSNNESSDFDHQDDPSFPRPPPEQPDAEFDAGEEISVVMNDELEYFNPKDELDDDDYSSFMFVIYSKVFSFLLSAESEDTIFDP
nr:flavonoid 3'-monooxygenase-like [Tanacetum cinerariifolium]